MSTTKIAIDCGTDAGWREHRRRRVKACPACVEAHTIARTEHQAEEARAILKGITQTKRVRLTNTGQEYRNVAFLSLQAGDRIRIPLAFGDQDRTVTVISSNEWLPGVVELRVKRHDRRHKLTIRGEQLTQGAKLLERAP
ncbi:hypothetical protein GS982_01670 [Rhodococcus hoagii]|uniref:Uncharacterized protein n=1 Tax=Rhodococcus hoagii TaxID=43767 RepID=A0A9Q4ZIQ3_RHOHA|nr:hypothetical protein [Prescottella equi]NKT77306.1 hypothetical protein [Prescottella equi]NKZ81093.1 hypothetical protein [Prescottella equi]